MPSDLQVSNIRDLNNANSAISIASDGQVTITQNNPTLTLGTNATFPKGSFTNYSVMVERETSAVTSRNYLPTGTGTQIVKHNAILPITADSAFTTEILSLSSNLFTLRTGYYHWRHSLNLYSPDHWHHFGLLTYGDSSGSGSSTSNITNDNVNYGSIFNYAQGDGTYLENSGVVKVTSQNQKYGFYISVQVATYAGTSGLETYHSTNHHGINTKAEFFRIGDV